MTATSDDYLWFEQRFPELSEAYCVTMVHGVTPAELLDRFGAVGERSTLVGVGELLEPSYAVWDEHDGDVQLVATASVGGWALAVEVNGYLGVTEDLFQRLSAGTRFVSHFCNVNAVGHFYLVENGQVRLGFEPLFAWYRYGSDPDGYVDLMRTAGLRMKDDDDIGEPGAAAFALGEAITGIRLTADLFEQASFTCGKAPVPGHVHT